MNSQLVALFCAWFLLAGSVSAQSANKADPTTGRIVLIEPSGQSGVLKVRQSSKLRPINANEGMLVRRGSVLILNPAGRATILCGDGTKRELAPGPQGCPCRRPCTPEVCGIRYSGSTIAATRGPDTSEGAFPVVISPRKTLLVNPRPTIRWSPVAGARPETTYRITIFGEGTKLIWSKDVVAKTRVDYPDAEPPLAPGQTYKVVVTCDGLSSQQDQSPGLGVTTLTAAQARTLADEQSRIRRLELPEAQTRFLIANLYAARELYAEAIEQLEELAAAMKRPAIASTLGDLYAVIGLNREAEQRYLDALDQTPADDLEGRGAIERNLAQVYENLGMYEQARAWLSKAMEAYRRLGRARTVRGLLNERRRLKEPGRQL
jgi:hypothetical protein